MREILFRGKRLDNGEWVESGNINTQTDMYGKEHTYMGLYETSNFAPLQRTIYWVEVIPETVGEYVGFEDKTRKKIFEGDVIEVYDRRYQIIDIRRFHLFLDCVNKAKVIGNIYDNPELLEGKDV